MNQQQIEAMRVFNDILEAQKNRALCEHVWQDSFTSMKASRPGEPVPRVGIQRKCIKCELVK